MDTLTQGLLGATCGQAFYGHRLGWRRATFWGAVLGSVPDLDVLVIPLTGPLGEFRYHRALTHSLWFGLLAGVVLGWMLWRATTRRARAPVGSGPRLETGTLADWIGLAVLAVVTHPLLDLFTTYGTLLLWPWPQRFALDAVAILDPFYSLQLLLALVLGWRWHSLPQRGALVALAALISSTTFLFYGLGLNERAAHEGHRQLAPSAGPGLRVQAYPTLLQPWLRRLVARDGRRVQVGLLSLWQPHTIAWRSFEVSDDERLAQAQDTPDGRLFLWFAQGQVSGRVLEAPTGPHWPSGATACVEFDDLRYGYGADPELGLWGIRLCLDAEGRQVGVAERFNRRPAGVPATLARLWQATFRPLD